MNKDIKHIVGILEDAKINPGWRVEDRKKHLMAFPPDRSIPAVRVPTTPSDHRSIKNLRAELRRAGAQGI